MSPYVAILPSRSNATSPAIDATSAAALAQTQSSTTPRRNSPRQSSRDRTAAKAPRPSAGAQKFMKCQKASVACTGGGKSGVAERRAHRPYAALRDCSPERDANFIICR